MSNILNVFSGTKSRGYSIVGGDSYAGANVDNSKSVVGAFPGYYNPGSDIALFISSATFGTSTLGDGQGLDWTIGRDSTLRFNTESGTDEGITTRTNMQVFKDGVGSAEVMQVVFGNPVTPTIGSAARAVFNVQDSVPLRMVNSWVVIRKSANIQQAGSSGSGNLLSGFAASSDSIATPDTSDPNTYQEMLFHEGMTSRTSVSTLGFDGLIKNNDFIPLPGDVGSQNVRDAKSYLIIAVATSTNSLLQSIEWGLPGGDLYWSNNQGGAYQLVKIYNATLEEYIDAAFAPVTVNNGAAITGSFGVAIGYLGN